MDGKGLVHTSSPRSPSMCWPASDHTSTAMARPGRCNSPFHTGEVGSAMANDDTRSVPPEMEGAGTSFLIEGWPTSKLSGARGEPVEVISRMEERSWVLIGSSPDFFTASMYF